MDALFLEVAALSERLKIPRSVLETVWDMCKKTVFFSLFIIILLFACYLVLKVKFFDSITGEAKLDPQTGKTKPNLTSEFAYVCHK